MNILRHKDELVLAAGLGATYLLTKSAFILKEWALWSSIIVLCLTTLYYSYNFFRSTRPGIKLAFFLMQALFILFYFALIYRAFGIVDTATGATIKPDWLNALYFSVVTWTTLGYGDFRPVDEAKIWVMAEAMLGYIFMGLFMAKILFLVRGNPTTKD